jgi:hypothetical protein
MPGLISKKNKVNSVFLEEKDSILKAKGCRVQENETGKGAGGGCAERTGKILTHLYPDSLRS